MHHKYDNKFSVNCLFVNNYGQSNSTNTDFIYDKFNEPGICSSGYYLQK
jgi:hypothetical protein